MCTNWAWKTRSKAKLLPMYHSRFRGMGGRYSAIDVCFRPSGELFSGERRTPTLPPAKSPFSSNKLETFLWGELFCVACDLYELSYMLDFNARYPKQFDSVKREAFEDTYTAAFHSLASFTYPDDATVMKTTTYYRQHAWRMAAIIYLNTAIRNWDAPMHSKNDTITDFIFYLRASDMNSMWSSNPEVLLWSLFVAVCETWDKSDRRWLLLEISHGIRILGIETAQKFEALLKNMLFVDSMRVKYLDRIWEEATNCNQIQ